jgi:hypothetical protein
MLNEFKHSDHHDWDDPKITRCCPEPPPPPPNPPSSDCCYVNWNWELTEVNWKLKEINNELAHAQKHLTVVTTRYNRLKQWHDELSTANELAFKICRQLEVIEAQLENICKNCCFTVRAVEILYCMIREFYLTCDYIVEKWDRLMNCIKCLNNPALTTTQGIGLYLTTYGTALTTVVNTRTTLIPLVMTAVDQSIKLHREICDIYGYEKLIEHWQETLRCGIPCGKEGTVAISEPLVGTLPPNAPSGKDVGEAFCLEPILHFPICNDWYFKEIEGLYEAEKEELRILTHDVNELTKKQLALTAVQQSLVKALKEVTPS